MNKSACLLTVFMVMLSVAMPVSADDAVPARNKPLPDVMLPVPGDGTHRDYLNLSDNRKTFSIGQLQADAVIIEIFSMYCPFCQREAPRVNLLFDLIQSDPQLRQRLKMIGIGVGNSAYEVDYFRKSYDIAFPLFPDEDFKIHKRFGQVRTPFFIGIRLAPGKKPVVFHTQLGGFVSPRAFLNQIVKLGGLGEEK